MILAHVTFLFSEMLTHYVQHSLHIPYIGFSGVVATVIAGVVMGNYGKYKLTPHVEKQSVQIWEFMAFIANSLIFILIGLSLSKITNIDFLTLLLPTFVVILIVVIARAVSVYLPIGFLNKTKLIEEIPLSWQHILTWGSLRGALAIILVLMIP